MNGGAGATPADGEEGADGSDRLVDELRAVALLALDRLDPLLARLGEAVADGAREAARDGAAHGPGAPCPLCTALAAVRSGSEPARRLAEHATGLVAALRDTLAEPAAPSDRPSDPPVPAGPARDVRVEHIPVERVPVERGAGGVAC